MSELTTFIPTIILSRAFVEVTVLDLKSEENILFKHMLVKIMRYSHTLNSALMKSFYLLTKRALFPTYFQKAVEKAAILIMKIC